MKNMKLAAAPAVALALVFQGCNSTPGSSEYTRIEDVPSLGGIWEEHFQMGNIVSSVNYLDNPDRVRLLSRHFSIITPENEMKPSWIQSQQGEFNWVWADRIVEFAGENGFAVHGHTLAWHSQSPVWLNSDDLTAAQARANLESYIATVVGRFAGRVASWDVVNEAFENWPDSPPENDDWRTRLRKIDQWDSPDLGPRGQRVAWERRLGPDYIEIAFRAARAADPDALLYYNDYNFDNYDKALSAFLMVKELNEKYRSETGGTRNLIDVIGMQGHYHRGPIDGETNDDVAYPYPVNIDNVRRAIELFSTLDGVSISITELDVTVGNTNIRPLTSRQERQQAIMYAQLFRVLRDNSQSIRRVSMWGISDSASWRANGSPLLFDANMQPKEAFWAVANPDAFLDRTNAYLANPRAFIDARHWQ